MDLLFLYLTFTVFFRFHLGKALLIELSPRPSHESPMISSKPIRDPYKSLVSSDSGVFDYSTATSHHPTMSSSSWRNQASSTIIDEANRTSTVIRDSGAYADSPTTTPSLSARYGRRQTSDTDQTTIHGGDDSVSRSTQKYETEIVSNEPSTSRYVRRQITRSPPSEYENIANYHSGMNAPRKVPITTQSRSLISTKPLVIDEYETVETETRVECQIQRTHEIKESTTRTEGTGSPHTPKKVVTTTTTTTTTTRSPETSSDEAIRTLTPSRRVLVNERPQYQETIRTNGKSLDFFFYQSSCSYRSSFFFFQVHLFPFKNHTSFLVKFVLKLVLIHHHRIVFPIQQHILRQLCLKKILFV